MGRLCGCRESPSLPSSAPSLPHAQPLLVTSLTPPRQPSTLNAKPKPTPHTPAIHTHTHKQTHTHKHTHTNKHTQDDFTRLTALKWLKEFVEMAGPQLVGRYGDLIGAVLPNISHASRDIQQARLSMVDFVGGEVGGLRAGTAVTAQQQPRQPRHTAGARLQPPDRRLPLMWGVGVGLGRVWGAAAASAGAPLRGVAALVGGECEVPGRGFGAATA